MSIPREKLLHLLVQDATEYALILLDPEQKIVFWNKGAEKILGHSEAEVMHRPITLIFTPEDVNLGVADKEIEKAREEGWADDERWHCRKDGSRIWASGVVTCLKEPDGKVIGYSKVFRDQSLRKNTEDRVKSHNDELRLFTRAVSHDLQEPLRMVASYVGLAQRKYSGELPPDFSEIMEVALQAANRMRGLLDDLLSFASLEKPVPFESTDSAAVFDIAVSNLRVAIEETGAVVTRVPLPAVRGNSTQLVQLFQNLIGNGIKYHRPGEKPLVLANVTPKDGYWKFCISDNGIGIPENLRENLFQPFYRLHSRNEYPGNGLGLYLCRKIIQKHGGDIWIESEPGKGTNVLFTLPRCGDESSLHGGATQPPKP